MVNSNQFLWSRQMAPYKPMLKFELTNILIIRTHFELPKIRKQACFLDWLGLFELIHFMYNHLKCTEANTLQCCRLPDQRRSSTRECHVFNPKRNWRGWGWGVKVWCTPQVSLLFSYDDHQFKGLGFINRDMIYFKYPRIFRFDCN